MTLYTYRWRTACNGTMEARYHGQRCIVVARGKLNSALVEFESGERAVISRNALRRAEPLPPPSVEVRQLTWLDNDTTPRHDATHRQPRGTVGEGGR